MSGTDPLPSSSPSDGWGDIPDFRFRTKQALEAAEDHAARGAIPDALLWLERALAPDFPGFHDFAARVACHYGSSA